MNARFGILCALVVAFGCSMDASRDARRPEQSADAARAESAKTVEDALAFIADSEATLAAQRQYAARVFWVKANFITADTDWLAARTDAESTELEVSLANATKAFEGLPLDARAQRKMNILRTGITLPAPTVDGAAGELADITTWLASTYATGRYELDGRSVGLPALEKILAESRDPAELEQAWTGWRTISPPMAERYERMVEIANEGARELGFGNLAEMWLSKYEMSAADMESEIARLWSQVRPLYEALHCEVRAGLSAFYGEEVQPAEGLIRADLLGNMWAQSWSNIYDIVAPEGAHTDIDLTRILNEQHFTPRKMVEVGEHFFTSLGFEPLPETFWERSLITQPVDRDVECHASAWDIDQIDDVRIKMCAKVDAEDFRTIHHELGHNFYQRAYAGQDYLFRGGAHDGFHEAIGDFVALSITPEYLRELGLISESEVPDSSADVGLLMQEALDKIAFVPFGLLVDSWRWKVLRGEVARNEYNDAWWDLRRELQGIRPPKERPPDAFDPGAKYHIPANTPYLRYFLSYVMQFQLQKAACKMAGWEGPLHRCSIYGNKEVGARLNGMLAMGASRPWPDALEAFTGTRRMDASAIIEYFEPLTAYLEMRNAGRQCGW